MFSGAGMDFVSNSGLLSIQIKQVSKNVHCDVPFLADGSFMKFNF